MTDQSDPIVKLTEKPSMLLVELRAADEWFRVAVSYDEAENLQSELRTVLANRRGYERMNVPVEALEPGDLLFERRELVVTNVLTQMQGWVVETTSNVSDVDSEVVFRAGSTPVPILRVIS